jgi:branched-chain amino acid transport system substrate-binding protein
VALASNQEKSLEAMKLVHALEDMKLPPEIGLQQSTAFFRKGDHQLMSDVFVGQAHGDKGNPDDLFTVGEIVPGEEAAGTVESTGCKLSYPA